MLIFSFIRTVIRGFSPAVKLNRPTRNVAVERNNFACGGTNLPITVLDFRRSGRIKASIRQVLFRRKKLKSTRQRDPNRLSNRAGFLTINDFFSDKIAIAVAVPFKTTETRALMIRRCVRMYICVRVCVSIYTHIRKTHTAFRLAHALTYSHFRAVSVYTYTRSLSCNSALTRACACALYMWEREIATAIRETMALCVRIPTRVYLSCPRGK